jgi:predicted phage terminase large subunit-like protein
MATGTSGQATGEGGDIIILDDPINPRMAGSETELKNAIEFYEKTIYSRLNEHEIGLRVIVMQRLHEDDLCGHLLSKSPGKYQHICLPGEETDDINPPEARRFYVDGLFDQVRFSRSILADHKEVLTDYGFSGQINQRPAPEVGGMFKKYNWCFWGDGRPVKFKNEKGEWVTCRQAGKPGRFDEQLQAWDLPFKDTEGTSFASGGHWGRVGPDIYLLDEDHRHLDYPGAVDAVRSLSARYPGRSCILVEDKANGPAVIADLRRSIPAIIPVKAEVDKVTRATPFSRAQAARNIFLPHPDSNAWVYDFIGEFAKFPKGKYNDRVDMAAHAYNKFNDYFEYQNVKAKI